MIRNSLRQHLNQLGTLLPFHLLQSLLSAKLIRHTEKEVAHAGVGVIDPPGTAATGLVISAVASGSFRNAARWIGYSFFCGLLISFAHVR